MTDTDYATRREPAPIPGTVDVLPLVLADLQARAEVGRVKYGTTLQVDNGRDHLIDAYQEALDLVVYLRAEFARRQELEAHNDRLRRERAAALNVTSRNGLLSSEWVLRTGLAERRAEAAEARVAEAEDLIRHAVELMTPDQVGRWAGVRAWQELAE